MSTGFPWNPKAEKNALDKAKYGLEMKVWKKERINYHREHIVELLTAENPPEDIDWEDVLEDHLMKTAQFQHERYMHLVVTMTFAICSIMVMCFVVFLEQMVLMLLLLALLILLIPYIFYYFMLENNTQAMYPLCDGIMEKVWEQRKKQRKEKVKNEVQ